MAEPARIERPLTEAPGPGARFMRTGGQLGGALVLLELWVAFGWLGADSWSERQSLAVFAVGAWVVSLLQNLIEARFRGTEVAPIGPPEPVDAEEPQKHPITVRTAAPPVRPSDTL